MLFQFLHGAIKRESPLLSMRTFSIFRFLHGAIKSVIFAASTGLLMDFNSFMVRLKGDAIANAKCV